jgi:peptide/nickel transport system permease protein
MVYGTRVSLVIGVLAVSVAMIIGVTIGLVGGYYGGKLDELLDAGDGCDIRIP